MVVTLPRLKQQSVVIVDDVGVKVGNRVQILWTETESMIKRGWSSATFLLKDGSKKRLSFLDWPVERREQFFNLLEAKAQPDD